MLGRYGYKMAFVRRSRSCQSLDGQIDRLGSSRSKYDFGLSGVDRLGEGIATFLDCGMGIVAVAVVLGGGVAANSRLREKMDSDMPVPVIVPIPKLCTDNGAMIGAAAYFRFRDGFFQEWDMDAIPNLKL